MIFAVYRFLVILLAPFICVLAWVRLLKGHEEGAHIRERRGIATLPAPAGPVLWVHAASVGEMRSAMPVVLHLLDKNPQLHCLVTTVTVTAARLVKAAKHPRVLHQYAPFDHPMWVARFLNHWAPQAVLWMESELWPTTLGMIKARGVPLAMVNGRLSARSARRWARLPHVIKTILGHFDLCLAQSPDDAARLQALGAPHVVSGGNIKYAGPALAYDAQAFETLAQAIGQRPRILFASTHSGEESMATEIHGLLAPHHGGLLSIIMPRHPKRGDEIAAICKKAGLCFAQRSSGQPVSAETQVYIADTLGEPGLFFRLCAPPYNGVVYMGNSLVEKPGGGHNPIEPAQLGCPVVYGPSMFNFSEIDTALRAAGGAIMVPDRAALAHACSHLLATPHERSALANAALAFVATQNDVLQKTLALLRPHLNRAKIEA